MNARLDKKKRKKRKKTYLEMSGPPGSESSLNVSCAVWGEIVVSFAATLGGHWGMICREKDEAETKGGMEGGDEPRLARERES